MFCEPAGCDDGVRGTDIEAGIEAPYATCDIDETADAGPGVVGFEGGDGHGHPERMGHEIDRGATGIGQYRVDEFLDDLVLAAAVKVILGALLFLAAPSLEAEGHGVHPGVRAYAGTLTITWSIVDNDVPNS